jgi:hypothetical protein
MGDASGAREGADTHKVKLVAVGLALVIAVGYLLGGRLSQLSDLKPRYAPSALIGLLLQLVNPSGSWLLLLLVSFVSLSAFTLVNIRTAGSAVILAGVAMNFAVIAGSGGSRRLASSPEVPGVQV